MAASSDQPLSPNPDAIMRRVGDGGVLVLVSSGRVFELNATATRTWELISSGESRPAILNALAEEFAGDPTTVAADVDELLSWLGARGLLTA